MTTTDPLVQAVAEGWWNASVSWPTGDYNAQARAYAAVAVAVLVPLIRAEESARIAEQIRALPTPSRSASLYANGLIDGYRTAVAAAARIAEGTDRG